MQVPPRRSCATRQVGPGGKRRRLTKSTRQCDVVPFDICGKTVALKTPLPLKIESLSFDVVFLYIGVFFLILVCVSNNKD